MADDVRDLSRVTKADLAVELTEAKIRAEGVQKALNEQMHAWEGLDTEARAIARCVTALDVVQRGERNSRSDYLVAGYGPSYDRIPGPIERVLDYLRVRYSVPSATTERDALRGEVERLNRELMQARERAARITEVVQS